jgi:hypothetical protein
VVALTGIVLLVAVRLLTEEGESMKVTTKHHVLRYPLIVYSGGPQSQIGILPRGTSLRYVESFPEGFDRFIVFVNVERSPLPLDDISPPELVDPLSAPPGRRTITTEELQKLLHSLSVERGDLNKLLESYE